MKNVGEKEATRLASEVLEIYVKNNKLYHYLGNDMEMYQGIRQESPVQISEELESYRFTDEGDVIVHNESDSISKGSLLLNGEEIAADVNNFSYYFGNLAYTTSDGELYLMKDMKKPKLVDEDVSAYTKVDYYGLLAYLHELNFPDIAGFWHTEHDDYVRFYEDGTLEDLRSGELMDLMDAEIIHSQVDMFQIEIDGDEIEFRTVGREGLEMNILNSFDYDDIDSNRLYLTRVTEEEAREALDE